MNTLHDILIFTQVYLTRDIIDNMLLRMCVHSSCTEFICDNRQMQL